MQRLGLLRPIEKFAEIRRQVSLRSLTAFLKPSPLGKVAKAKPLTDEVKERLENDGAAAPNPA